MDDIRTVVRALRAGEEVRGAELKGDILVYRGQAFRIQGTERLRVTEVPMGTLPGAAPEAGVEPEAPQAPAGLASGPERKEDPAAPAREPRRPRGELAVDSLGLCSRCGAEFTKSKFNPYFTECPACRGTRGHRPPAEGRAFTCPECGKGFTVSKFQPYLTPERCPECNGRAARARYRERKGAGQA